MAGRRLGWAEGGEPLPEPVFYGGQAVIEGVMMRGPEWMAIAVRKPDRNIALHVERVDSVLRRYPVLRLPILRGVIALWETMKLGLTALLFSVNQAAPEEEQLSKGELTITTAVGIVLALAVFVALPTWLGSLLERSLGSGWWVQLLEGGMRLGIFLGYLKAISLVRDIQRVFQYHGAEHKVINCFEAGDELTVENVRRHSREHKRCGTSFLLYVVVISILLFSLVNWPNLWLKIVGRLALLPLVAGISYELIRLAGRYDTPLVNALSRPGLWLQGFTTREPDDDQIEVAIASFQAARGFGLPG